MLQRGIAAARLVLNVTLNAVGFVAVLAAAWFMPEFLALILGPARFAG